MSCPAGRQIAGRTDGVAGRRPGLSNGVLTACQVCTKGVTTRGGRTLGSSSAEDDRREGKYVTYVALFGFRPGYGERTAVTLDLRVTSADQRPAISVVAGGTGRAAGSPGGVSRPGPGPGTSALRSGRALLPGPGARLARGCARGARGKVARCRRGLRDRCGDRSRFCHGVIEVMNGVGQQVVRHGTTYVCRCHTNPDGFGRARTRVRLPAGTFPLTKDSRSCPQS